MSSDALRFLLTSGGLIIILIAVYYLVNKAGFSGDFPFRRRGIIEIVDRVPIDRERGILLIRVREEVFLLFYSGSYVQLLKEWKDEIPADFSGSPPFDGSGKG